ncbi:24496_t:CDS:2, partial [Entrophospora sp. SA101]
KKGDGIGFTNDVNKYQLVYIEGSCPHNVREKKEIDDRCYHLVEIDNATVPQDFSEIEDFVYFYEAIIKWA